jgi:hypothetical protein
MYGRHLLPELRAALADTPVTILVGPRQSGKSTLAQALVEEIDDARYVSLDRGLNLAAARDDPAGFVAGEERTLVIDEVQRAPDLLREIEESSTLATIWGGGSNPFSAADDMPFAAASRYQAASCAALEFKPKLGIKLRGGVKRGAHPALRAVVTPRPGEANFSRAVVTLPRSAFLDQAHIRTICTRVQFAAGPGNGALCPKGAQYGYARAWSPLLDEPAEGPVYLRSSDNNLPDLVVALKGPASAPVDIELSARIDSIRGGIRSTFAAIPDLPVSRFILDMQGGKKGLIVNSRHLCHKPKRNRAKSNIRGQNGRLSRTKPRLIATKCQQRRKAQRNRAKRSTGHIARASKVR